MIEDKSGTNVMEPPAQESGASGTAWEFHTDTELLQALKQAKPTDAQYASLIAEAKQRNLAFDGKTVT